MTKFGSYSQDHLCESLVAVQQLDVLPKCGFADALESLQVYHLILLQELMRVEVIADLLRVGCLHL